MKLRLRRRTIWTMAIGAVTALVVVLLVLIGLGILIIPGTTPAPYTVSGVVVTIIQGTTSSGGGWFGSSPQNYSSLGAFAPGSTFVFPWTFSNFDTTSHNITSVTAAPPFSVVSVSPSLPNQVPRGADSARLEITVRVPNDGGGSGVLMLTVSAVA
jgi:hypothetical protein